VSQIQRWLAQLAISISTAATLLDFSPPLASRISHVVLPCGITMFRLSSEVHFPGLTIEPRQPQPCGPTQPQRLRHRETPLSLGCCTSTTSEIEAGLATFKPFANSGETTYATSARRPRQSRQGPSYSASDQRD
jgi:hypothetical protein